MIKPVEINVNLRPASLYTRISALIVKAAPPKYLPIINSAADVVGKIMTSRLIEYGMRILFDRSYDLGAARRLAGGTDTLKLPLSFFSWPENPGIVLKTEFFPFEISAYMKHSTGYPIDWDKGFAALKDKRLWDCGRKSGLLDSKSNAPDVFPLKYAQGSAQIGMGQFRLNVRMMMEELIGADKSQSVQKMHERLSMAIELPDGTLVPIFKGASNEEEFSCGLPSNYKELEKAALAKVKISAQENPRMLTSGIKIYHIHTHPEVQDMYIDRDSDGQYITGLSRKDYTMAELAYLHNLVRRVRAIGFTGQVEIIMGAVPVLAGEKAGAERKVATYTQKYPPIGSNMVAA